MLYESLNNLYIINFINFYNVFKANNGDLFEASFSQPILIIIQSLFLLGTSALVKMNLCSSI